MSFTVEQKIAICVNYWVSGKSWVVQKTHKGLADLTYSDFQKFTDTGSFFYGRGMKDYRMDWIFKPDNNSTGFSEMTEEEIFDLRVKLYGKEPNVEWDMDEVERLKRT